MCLEIFLHLTVADIPETTHAISNGFDFQSLPNKMSSPPELQAGGRSFKSLRNLKTYFKKADCVDVIFWHTCGKMKDESFGG